MTRYPFTGRRMLAGRSRPLTGRTEAALERIAGILADALERPCDNCDRPTACRVPLAAGDGQAAPEVPLCRRCQVDSSPEEVAP